MTSLPLFSRTPRDFTALKVWGSSLVAGDEGALAAGSGGGSAAQGAVQKPVGRTAAARARHVLTLKLEAAPHPTDDFIKGDGF